MPVIYRLNEGGKILLFLVLVTKVGDTGAYIIGTLTNKIMKGNHKILPSISPKKSWEGTVGGLVCSVIMSVAIWNILPFESDSFNLLKALFAGIILFIGGFAGDLMESSVKRACGVKDSGNIIPGMGGVLDIVDSLIINAPVFYWFLYFFYLRFSS
jgi:phosphatidate cytidylyltransferase